MIIKHLEISNFRKYSELNLDFPEGVIGVVGRNGSGKSTLLEVFAWMLYGSVGLKTKNVDLFPDFIESKGVTEGVMTFESGGVNFRIERGFKQPAKSTAMLYVEDKIVASGTREVSAEIEKLSGMDWKAFQTSFYTRQNELNLLGSLQPAERSRRLEEMLGLERTNIIINNIKGDLRSMEGEIKGLGQLIEREAEYKESLQSKKTSDKEISLKIIKIDGETGAFENKVAALKAQFSRAEKEREKFQSLSSRLALMRQDCDQKQKRADLLAEQVSQIESQKDVYGRLKTEIEKLPEVQKNIEELEKQQLKFEALKQKKNQMESLQKTIAAQIEKGQALGEEIEKLQKQVVDRDIINNNIGALEEKIESMREKTSNLRVKRETAFADLVKLRDQLKDIEKQGPEAVCSFCLRPFEGEMDNIKEHFESDMKELEKQEKAARDELERNQKELANALDNRKILEKERSQAEKIAAAVASAEGERKILRESYKSSAAQQKALENEINALGEVSFDADLFVRTRNELGELQKKRAEFSALSERMAGLDNLRTERKELLEAINSINNNIASLEKDLKELAFSEEAYLELKQSLEEETRALDSKRREFYELKEKYAGLKAEIKGMENQLENITSAKKRSSEISGEKVYLESLIELLKELKTELAKRIRPTLIEYSSRLLERMSDGKFSELHLNENYEIYIRDYGELCELNRFSGGEQDLANLSLRLAISKLLAQSSHLEAGFLILDEVFGSQDSFRKEMILGAIAGLQDFFRQIFIVTHVDDVKEAVQTLMTIEENPDGSSSVIVD